MNNKEGLGELEEAPEEGKVIVDILKEEKEAAAKAGAPEEPKEKDPVDTSPNIMFVGTRNRNGEKERMAEAPLTLISGPNEYTMPPSEEQLQGFYHEKSAEICRAFPGLYKPIIKKGE